MKFLQFLNPKNRQRNIEEIHEELRETEEQLKISLSRNKHSKRIRSAILKELKEINVKLENMEAA